MFNAGHLRGEDLSVAKKVSEPMKHLIKSFGTPTLSFRKFWYPYHKVLNSSKSFRTLFTTLQ